MNTKHYVSPEAARLLKEKGYDKPTDYIYVIDGQFYSIWRNKDGNMESNYYPAPTKAEAIDWLDSNGTIIELSVTHDLCHWVFSIYMKGREDILTNTDFDFESFPTRLQAEEAAIIKSLTLLN